ncbi:MAG: DUF1343 domain-containing protein [Flavobacterium sp.]|uniref:exo-beta-N-acetylmuramidase NamZ family protein n=1 Tax=Flavobacterium sp. TaxID=239 RepID=UPI0011FDE5C7|nr:DUF1343 domain-containing protein [Flavobacterium sp.]RZJ66503.1 MAG: DUF1343 domain-containing protein [Flavobacterium sp.]
MLHSLPASLRTPLLFSKRLSLVGILLAIAVSCKTPQAKVVAFSAPEKKTIKSKIRPLKFMTGADNTSSYLDIIADRRVGIVTNQTGLISYDSIFSLPDSLELTHREATVTKTMHIVDYLKRKTKVNLDKIYAPEHGFRGTADAGEDIVDGKDVKTGIPIISIYGNNKKPSAEQLQGIDVMLFDLQDVGTRFYTYISTLHYVMEACAENKIELIILDRPNPNGYTVDGPTLEPEHKSFVGMHPIPVLHGMTIGEYALMINGEKWLKDSIQCDVKIVPCENYRRTMPYSLPVKPSPNLPNDQAINLYPSLCFFEGTNVSIGRGTTKQFQIYGSPFLRTMTYEFLPLPNEGAKDPPHNGKICCGEDLSKISRLNRIELKWLIKAYNETQDKSKFFISYFTLLAGTRKLQSQIESGLSEDEIRASWQPGIEEFKKIRKVYEIY